ncbi:alkyl sulfatase dimerization domain-containing protein [Francisella sp. 19X1-34]|uniref:alkyl/aryl-sulfatase n=1 Tax=Francisella sp. 19X1-34 TaxID=3087177 RepID=UPI002E313A0E|nr:alkyl sulfatase dimerization domain-containing protein [Francisella sp. 19X1-34]MED7788746.1 alkyl sulfatase dimerization domain-containing protein [Francisella sp. 19X1-34]
MSKFSRYKECSVPTSYTLEINQSYKEKLPFADDSSFLNAKRGFIAPLANNGIVKDDSGKIVWDPTEYDFIINSEEVPDTVNPSLWRQAKLLLISGLFKVTEHIYQVRGLDISNLTIIETENGIIVIDPLTVVETAKAAMELYYKHRGQRKVLAIIYSHCHIDHYGGAAGVVSNQDVVDNEIQIIAPEGFLNHAISENLLAGKIMSHRANYMYGNLISKNSVGQIGAGLGMTVPLGATSLIPPNVTVNEDDQILQIDDIEMIFYMAHDSEAPSEMFFYIPKYKALCTAEDASQTMHNISTLRGASLRNPLLWSKYLNVALQKWGNEAEILYAPHHWPLWGAHDIKKHLTMQRDLYRYINDQTLRLANKGLDMLEIAERVELPKSLANYWSNREYYGSLNTNVKGTYAKYLGWFSGNPAELHPLATFEASKKYIEYMGGEEEVLKKAHKDYEENNYRWVAEILNKIVIVNPKNKKAKQLLASSYEQLAFQSENAPWRNFYLTEALKLRKGIKKRGLDLKKQFNAFMSIPLEALFDYLATNISPDKAQNKPEVKVGFVFMDLNKKISISFSNSTLSNTPDRIYRNADAVLSLTRPQFNMLLLSALGNKNNAKKELLQLAEKNELKIEGNIDKVGYILDSMDDFPYLKLYASSLGTLFRKLYKFP